MDLRDALRDLSGQQQRLRVWQHLVGELGRYIDRDEVENLVTDSGEEVGDDALQDVLSLVEQHAKEAEAELNTFLGLKVIPDDEKQEAQKPQRKKVSGRKGSAARRVKEASS